MKAKQTPTRIPRAEDAEIDPRKLTEYVLNPSHRTGRHKARVFKSALGIEREDWMYLRDQILERLPDAEVERHDSTQHGDQYRVVLRIDGLNGETHPVKVRWRVPPGRAPCLVTAWVES